MLCAAGTRGSPGMVMISPQITTRNSAPPESRTSRIGTTWPLGAPFRLGSVEKLYWVLATQIGKWPKPCVLQLLELGAHPLVGDHVLGAVDLGRDRAHLVPERHLVGIEVAEAAAVERGRAVEQAHDVRGERLGAGRAVGPVRAHDRLDAELVAAEVAHQLVLGLGVAA